MASETLTPTTFTQAAGNFPWSDLSDAGPSDDAYASASNNISNFSTFYLICTGLGFGIPGSAVIDGIEVSVERKSSHNSATVNCKDVNIRLTKDGAQTIGDDKSDLVTKWPLTDTTATYGGAAVLWGLTWTAAEVNAATFGIGIRVRHFTDGTTLTSFIDHVEITVTYTTTGGGGSTAGSFLIGMIAPRKLISFPGLWTPRPRPIYQFCQRRLAS